MRNFLCLYRIFILEVLSFIRYMIYIDVEKVEILWSLNLVFWVLVFIFWKIEGIGVGGGMDLGSLCY